MAIDLRNVRADFDAMVKAFQQDLGPRDSWKDLFPGSSGQTIIEYISSIGTYSQHSIEQLFLETYLHTAKRDTSVYTIARMLGVRIGRKLSPVVSVQLTRQSASAPLAIPAWTQWSVPTNGSAGSNSGGNLVNFSPVVFDVGQLTIQVELFVGAVQNQQFMSDGSIFQEYVVQGLGPFTVSDIHLSVKVANVPYKVITDGLWNYTAADRVVSDNTKGDGSLLLLFGDDKFGTAPNTGQVITVQWIDTNGIDSTQIASGSRVTSSIPGIEGITLSASNGGGNEKDSEFYRIMAPHIYLEKDKPVTPDGYTAKFLEYPGVVDALVRFQKDIDPYDYRLMNNAYVSLLTQEGSVWQNEVFAPPPPKYMKMDGETGALLPGTYGYRISSVNEVGESVPGTTTTYTIATPSSILVQWNLAPNAMSYRVYGRVSGSERFLAEVTPAREDLARGWMYFVDDGAYVPGGLPPLVNNTQASWSTFVDWAQEYKHASLRLIQASPKPVPVSVRAVIYVKPYVDDLDTIKTLAYERLVKLFSPRLGSIGRKISVSDVSEACKVPSQQDKTVSDVDYVTVDNPSTDQSPPTIDSYLYLSSISLNVTYTDRRDRWNV